MRPCLESELSFDFKKTYLYERGEKTGDKWKVDNEAFNRLDPEYFYFRDFRASLIKLV